MMAWLWQQALGTVFLESGINSVYRFSVLRCNLEKSVLQPIAVRRKFYLIFAGEDFSIIIYKKMISVNYKTKKWGKKCKGACWDQKDQCINLRSWANLTLMNFCLYSNLLFSLCRTECTHYSCFHVWLCLHFLRPTFLTFYT